MWPFSRRDPDPVPVDDGQTLSDIVRGIAHAVNAAHDIADTAVLKQLKFFFDIEDDGTLVAKTARVRISPQQYLEVPLISVIDSAGLQLQEVDVRMAVRLARATIKRQIHDVNKEAEVERSSFSVSLTSAKPGTRNDVIDVTIKFAKVTAAEGLNRLLEEVNGMITPKAYSEDTPPPANSTPLTTRKERKEPDQDAIDTETFD